MVIPRLGLSCLTSLSLVSSSSVFNQTPLCLGTCLSLVNEDAGSGASPSWLCLMDHCSLVYNLIISALGHQNLDGTYSDSFADLLCGVFLLPAHW